MMTRRCDDVKLITLTIFVTIAGKLDASNVLSRHAISYRIQPRAQISDFGPYGLPSHCNHNIRLWFAFHSHLSHQIIPTQSTSSNLYYSSRAPLLSLPSISTIEQTTT